MTTTQTTARRIFRVLGSTNDVTTCELCGRDDLRGTLVLEVVDADGNGTGELLHYGSDCGARAAGWTVADMGKRVRAAEKAAAEAEAAERNRRNREQHRAYAAHLISACGTDDREKAAKARGFESPWQMWKADRAAGAPGTQH
jgi:hypothetical protein